MKLFAPHILPTAYTLSLQTKTTQQKGKKRMQIQKKISIPTIKYNVSNSSFTLSSSRRHGDEMLLSDLYTGWKVQAEGRCHPHTQHACCGGAEVSGPLYLEWGKQISGENR